MLAKELRRKYIEFFVKKYGHKEIDGSPLIPENDPTVLFTTAGMHPLVPYLLGEPHPEGKRLVDCQKCLRTDDIDEVGDDTHLTFFEMLGNWSLGDYFKEEAINMSMEFLVEELKLDPRRLYVSVFNGDEDAPKDECSIRCWEEVFKKKGVDSSGRIFMYTKKENWWGPAGTTGPCGPCTEMYYFVGDDFSVIGDYHPANSDLFVEIWNDVFMEYNKKEDGRFDKLIQNNVDTGLGLERVTALLQKKKSHYDTELFSNIINKIKELSTNDIKGSIRIIADHLRAATFLLCDKITPSNVDQGYILRRLIRRAIRHGHKLGIEKRFTHIISEIVINDYKDPYIALLENKDFIIEQLQQEEQKFFEALKHGEKEFRKLLSKLIETERKVLSGEESFYLYETYGFPIEITQELAKENGIDVDIEGFKESYKRHQDLSRKGAEHKFRGGLSDNTVETTKLHTATHLLHKALRMVLGDHVEQRGSNITAERLRFDFSHDAKLTPDQLKEVEEIVNDVIARALPVDVQEMTVDEAKSRGAIGLFEHKYSEKVKVYSIGDFSMEICGGPHIKNTKELKKFRILKEQSSSAGVRRIKAVIEK